MTSNEGLIDVLKELRSQQELCQILARRPTICSLSHISADWKEHLLVEYSKNTFACELMDGQVQDDRCKVVDDIIYYKDKIYLVPESKMKERILKEMHDSPLASHPRYLKIYRQIRDKFSWKGLKNDILQYMREFSTY